MVEKEDRQVIHVINSVAIKGNKVAEMGYIGSINKWKFIWKLANGNTIKCSKWPEDWLQPNTKAENRATTSRRRLEPRDGE
uniref:Ovule protein n=1 Tax=Steinernema glaseri TaxID=37863 RepID=A0A1I7Z6D6_9BILA